MEIIEILKFWVVAFGLFMAIIEILSVLLGLSSIKALIRFYKTRHLRKVWGIKDGDYVIVVCSELEGPEERQYVIEDEFIYLLKYGDVDAYFEVVVTLLRLFPNIKLTVKSSGEVEQTRIDFDRHLILIGGPDFNKMTERIINKGITQYHYKGPDMEVQSEDYPEKIVLYDRLNEKDYCGKTAENDLGYFERINNPDNPEKRIILIGGCHTTGVFGAAKAFSMAESEQGEIPPIILANAKKVGKKISSKSEFSVLVPVERVAQTIIVPIVRDNNIIVRINNKIADNCPTSAFEN